MRRPLGGVVLYEESLVGWAASQERVESLAAQIEAGTFNPALLLASPGNPSASK